jgi:hypothetical protein
VEPYVPAESVVLGENVSVAGVRCSSGIDRRDQDKGLSVVYTWQRCICLETRQGEASVLCLSGSILKAPGLAVAGCAPPRAIFRHKRDEPETTGAQMLMPSD